MDEDTKEMENGCLDMDSHLPYYHDFIRHLRRRVCKDRIYSAAYVRDNAHRCAADGFCDHAMSPIRNAWMVAEIM
jgi:hypothetical protein